MNTVKIELTEKQILDMLENMYFQIRKEENYNVDTHEFECDDNTSQWHFDLLISYNLVASQLPEEIRNKKMRWYRHNFNPIVIKNEELITSRIWCI